MMNATQTIPTENISIPINFLTVGAIVRAAEIERLKQTEGYGECVLDADKAVAETFTCADCLSKLTYVGLFSRRRERSFAVCPDCGRGFEF
jgi:hypothetical protein